MNLSSEWKIMIQLFRLREFALDTKVMALVIIKACAFQYLNKVISLALFKELITLLPKTKNYRKS